MLRDATPADFPAILELNQAFVRVLSPLDHARLARLHAQAALHRVIEQDGRVEAFLLVLREGADYDSPNYRWFAQRHARFLYVDRIVVAATTQARGAGSALYRDLLAQAAREAVPFITCEFDSEPPNPASARFHAKLGFREVGRQPLDGGRKTVSLQLLQVTINPPGATAMSTVAAYPIGTPGTPWGAAEVAAWRARQTRRRSYAADVLRAIESLRARFDVQQYGLVEYAPDSYPLFAISSRPWRDELPVVLVTGGVHGYETSGVHGALQFADQHAARYAGRANLVIAPCVSPWAYERIHRWNADALDPNRSFRDDSPAQESAALMRLVAPWRERVLVHVDLHETTDTDESEFRPALAARDGVAHAPGEIPDGFYLVDDSEHPQPAFQQAIIAAVAQVTHIAPADASGEIIGSPMVAPGVIRYPLRQLGLCAGITDARYTTTTEVYPDSPRATPEQCNAAQVAAVCAAIDFALDQSGDDAAF